MRALAFYISDSVNTLASCAKELAMDATYGTNNTGMQLFAVLAEVDGTGIPLAYCFIDVFNDDSHGTRRADPGATTALLNQFLRPLRDAGFNPTFFGTDKDLSEIAAVGQVWPNTSIQLCYWHARRAIRTKLTALRQTNTQGEYNPLDAQKLIPGLEICWGLIPTRRPNRDHRYGRCDCPSRLTNIVPQGRIETASGEEQDIVLNMFSQHYNSHPLIPDQHRTYRSPERIHRACAEEMYHWCKSRNYFRLWAYLWVNWYQPSQWKLWARSADDKEIPILKTTMIVESHWRKIKHDYLYRFNRPRIDLVIWILLSRLIPSALTRLHALL
jgi:MULE transposase domain